MRTDHRPIAFTALFFTETAVTEEPLVHNSAYDAISYTPDQYGTWEAFTQHPDYDRVKAQYAQIFTAIHEFLEAHMPHAVFYQEAFDAFREKIETGYYTDRAERLYGTGKHTFDTLHGLLPDLNIPLETRLTALRNLSMELESCIDGIINSLAGIVRQLQYLASGNIVGEVLRVKEQLLEQLVLQFHQQRERNEEDDEEDDDEIMEKHYIAAYQNFLRPHYGLLSLEQDVLADPDSLGIHHDELEACARFVAALLTPEQIVKIMAEAYLDEVQGVLPVQGEGLDGETAQNVLRALKARLTPRYGEIPDALLMEERQEQYYAPRHPTLIRLALFRTLQQHGIIDDIHDTLIYRYTMPDTFIARMIPDRVTGEFIEAEEKQRLRGETVSIYHTGDVFWACHHHDTPADHTPVPVSLLHLINVKSDAIPSQVMYTILVDTLQHTQEEEFRQVSSLLTDHPYLLAAYLFHKLQASSMQDIKAWIDLLSHRALSDQENFRQALKQTFSTLNYPLLAEREWTDSTTLVRSLYIFLSRKNLHLDRDPAVTETFFLNLLSEDMIPRSVSDRDRFTIEPLLIHAIRKEWHTLTQRLCILLPADELNATNASQQTALMIAAEKRHIELIYLLLIYGADPALISPEKGTALSHAVSAGQLETVRFLFNARRVLAKPFHLFSTLAISGRRIRSHFDLEAADAQGRTALMWLFRSDIPTETTQKILRVLVAEGANIHTRTLSGERLIDQSAVYTRGCLDILIKAGLDIRNPDNGTRIMAQLLLHGTREQAKKLIQQGLQIHFPGDHHSLIDLTLSGSRLDQTAFLLAHFRKITPHITRAAIVFRLSELMLRGPLSDTAQRWMATVLEITLAPALVTNADVRKTSFWAEFLRYQALTREAVLTTHTLRRLDQQLTVLQAYLGLSALTTDGDTPLMYLLRHAADYEASAMAFASHSHILRFLLQNTDQLHKPDRDGFTPFLMAAQTGNTRAMQILLETDPSLLDAPDAQGNTPLMLATHGNLIDAMAWLIAQKAEVNAGNAAGHTALALASMRQHHAGIQMLLQAGADPCSSTGTTRQS